EQAALWERKRGVESAGRREIALGAVVAAEGREGEAAVVVARRDVRGERDAGAEGFERVGEPAEPQGALAAIELGPEVVRLELRGAVKCHGGFVQLAGAEQRSAQRVVLPGGARLKRAGARRRGLGQRVQA